MAEETGKIAPGITEVLFSFTAKKPLDIQFGSNLNCRSERL
jgi:hypothetical protein